MGKNKKMKPTGDDEKTKTNTRPGQGVALNSKAIGKKGQKQNAQPKPNPKPAQTPKVEQAKQNGNAAKKVKPNKMQNGNGPKAKPNKEPPKDKPQTALKKKKDKKEKTKPTTKVESVVNDEPIVKINKRTKTRLKAEIKKEIILKGKSTSVLTNPTVVESKLRKLTVKTEPQSKKVQRKIVLLQTLVNRLKDNNKDKKGPKVRKDNEQSVQIQSQYPKHPRNNFVMFVGHLNITVTEDMIRDHFEKCGEIQAVRLPVPKKRKHKRFAYVQFANEEGRVEALKMHDTMIGECKINVLYSDKSKGNKKANLEKNMKLRTERKKLVLTSDQMMELGKKLKQKTNKIKDKKKFSKKV